MAFEYLAAIERFYKKYGASMMVSFTVVIIPCALYVFSFYREVVHEKDTLQDDRLVFETVKTNFYLEASATKDQLKETQEETERTQADVQRMMVELEKQVAIVNEGGAKALADERAAVLELKKQYEFYVDKLKNDYSEKARTDRAEHEILAAMKDFESLGVDMDSPQPCDSDYMKRYNKGKAIIQKIYALNEQYEVGHQYYLFATKNTHSISTIRFSDDFCNET